MHGLPGPIAPFDPDISAMLDEVVVAVAPKHLLAACETLREDPRMGFDYLRCLTVVDYEETLQVVYHLWSRDHRHKLTLKTSVPTDDPVAPSVTGVWPGADWFEREGHELFGVVFAGHPDLRPLLLWEGFEGYPGRKSYPFNEYTEW